MKWHPGIKLTRCHMVATRTGTGSTAIGSRTLQPVSALTRGGTEERSSTLFHWFHCHIGLSVTAGSAASTDRAGNGGAT